MLTKTGINNLMHTGTEYGIFLASNVDLKTGHNNSYISGFIPRGMVLLLCKKIYIYK